MIRQRQQTLGEEVALGDIVDDLGVGRHAQHLREDHDVVRILEDEAAAPRAARPSRVTVATRNAVAEVVERADGEAALGRHHRLTIELRKELSAHHVLL